MTDITQEVDATIPQLVTEGRRLATIRRIGEIEAIEGADMIVAASVDGWKVVTKKGEFKEGDPCVFFEIDSFLPAETKQFAFLAARGTRTDEAGVERCRLRTIKLKGVVSQGLALPISHFEDELRFAQLQNQLSGQVTEFGEFLLELEDERIGVEEFLNVTKYEPPAERENNGGGKAKTAGVFPHFIPKTDEDRIQNIWSKYKQKYAGVRFRKSLKMEGSSETIAVLLDPDYFMNKLDQHTHAFNEETGELEIVSTELYPFQWESAQAIICSRNQALKFSPESHFWQAALRNNVLHNLAEYCRENDRQLAVQGECMGPGIQGNIEKLAEPQFFAFRVWDIDNRCFLSDADFQELMKTLNITTVPQGEIIAFFDEYDTITEALASAEHESMNAKMAEGDVYKSIDEVDGQTIHFKVINNKYLLKEKDTW